MKCSCGFEERGKIETETEVFFKSGPRKGKLKTIEKKTLPPISMTKIDVMAEVTLGDQDNYYYSEYSYSNRKTGIQELRACPDCGLVYFKECWY